MRFILTNKLGKDDKMLMAFDAFVLSDVMGREIKLGKIIHGDDHAAVKMKTPALASKVRKRVEKIAALFSIPAPPDLVLNRHCAECEFQARCRQKAIETDDLSLLANMSAKERQELRSKGIFTVTQLSYTFRPRRRPKRQRDKREKYHHSLKALAMREKKIHIVGRPELKIEGTPVYLDVEGLPERDFYYLIGVRIGNGESSFQHSLWADTVADEGEIWREFLAILETVEKPVLIHYGSYETDFLKRMQDRHGEPLESSVPAKTVLAAVNLLSVIFARVYFPTFSNGLKDIAGFLGFKWSEPDARGLTSVMWRQAWEDSRNQEFKDKLIRYNAEDCEALAQVEQAIIRLGTHPNQAGTGECPELDVIRTEEMRHPLVNKWNNFKSPLKDLEVITTAAHWDYQRDRVYFRSGKAPRRARRKSLDSAKAKDRRRPDKLIRIETARSCPTCQRNGVKHGPVLSRTRHEILFGKSSVKRRLIRYEYQQYRCPKCKIVFGAEGVVFKRGQPNKYGRSLVAFLFYQIIELYIPARIAMIMLGRLFGLKLSSAMTTLFKADLARYYEQTHQQILARITSGSMVNADETFISIKGKRAYVWVLTNGREVVYIYSESREGELIQELLINFKGVLVSDFYAVYDSFDCPQQKCLIHLVRDLNDVLLDNPYDEEVKALVKSFGEVLRSIIEDIDRHGLKRHFLRKHVKTVKKFYRTVVCKTHQSLAAVVCADRFERNRDRLFTFLEYDGVPWNNNNAEHAMKAVAKLRDVIEGSATEKSIREYLILLSICQTCKYQELDFLDFLRFGEKDIHAFADSRQRRRQRPGSDRSTAIKPTAAGVADMSQTGT